MGTPEQRYEAVDACMRARGWEIERNLDDGWGWTLPPVPVEDRASILSDFDECEAEVGPPPVAETTEQIREVYEIGITHYECLMEAGFAAVAPPGFEAFEDQYRSGALKYDVFAELGPDDVTAALRVCPYDWDSWR